MASPDITSPDNPGYPADWPGYDQPYRQCESTFTDPAGLWHRCQFVAGHRPPHCDVPPPSPPLTFWG